MILLFGKNENRLVIRDGFYVEMVVPQALEQRFV